MIEIQDVQDMILLLMVAGCCLPTESDFKRACFMVQMWEEDIEGKNTACFLWSQAWNTNINQIGHRKKKKRVSLLASWFIKVTV